MGDSLGDVVGRERELAEVGAFLSAVPDGPSALLIDGDAGIGKTTVWLTAVRNAEDRGYRVLRARPAESESRLSYAALADIVGPVFEEIRSALPDPQERALATVMLRVATDGPADARTTATALVGVLATLADKSPVVLAIDDAQWLDYASARALEFAVRRLPVRLGVLATLRTAAAVGHSARSGPRDAGGPVRASGRRTVVARGAASCDQRPVADVRCQARARADRRCVGRQSVLRAGDGAEPRHRNCRRSVGAATGRAEAGVGAHRPPVAGRAGGGPAWPRCCRGRRLRR